MLVVLVLLALVAGIGLPAVQALIQGPVQRETTRLASLIRMLRNEAVLTRTDFHLVIDLKEGAYWVEQRTAGRFRPRDEPALLRKHTFPSGFTLTDLTVMGGTTPVVDKPVPLTVDSSGFMDPFLLHFTVSGQSYTLKVTGFRADMDVLPGYVRE
jgi:type II secretory pathway pseudopilin PulG